MFTKYKRKEMTQVTSLKPQLVAMFIQFINKVLYHSFKNHLVNLKYLRKWFKKLTCNLMYSLLS